MLDFVHHEIELKMFFDYGLDYLPIITDALKGMYYYRRNKAKKYIDRYYDSPDDKLLNKGYSYRIRYNQSKTHVNLKLPFRYNKDGLVSRREVKAEMETAELERIEDILKADCRANQFFHKLFPDIEIDGKFEIETRRELFTFVNAEADPLEPVYDIGVMCLDHSHLISGDRKIPLRPQFEIEMWNDWIDPDTFEKFYIVKDRLIESGFEIQRESRYQQISDYVKREQKHE